MTLQRLTARTAGTLGILIGAAAGTGPGPAAGAEIVADTVVPAAAALEPLRTELADRVASGELPSLAVGVFRRDAILWQEAMGWADREASEPATTRTPYGLASLGKSITSTAVMVLAERGEIDLERPINSYLGSVGLWSPAGHADAVTVRQVLDMSAGIPHGNYVYLRRQDALPLTPERLVRERGIVALPPGTVHAYSNFAYAALELLIERRSGQSFPDFLAREVFGSLGMDQAFAADSTAPTGAAARYGADGERLEPRFARPQSSLGLNASLQDLLGYARFHLGLAPHGRRPVLALETLERMHRQRAALPETLVEPLTALGWGSIELEGGLLWLLTNGRDDGAQATVTLLPSERLAVVVLTNVTGGVTDGIAFGIVDRLVPGFLERLGRKQVEWEARAYRPYEPTPELLGAWTGAVETPAGALPLELRFQPDGDIHVVLDGRDPMLLAGASWEEGLLTGRFLGRLPLDERADHPHRIELALHPGDGRLEGYATSLFTNDRGQFGLTAYLRVERQGPEADQTARIP